MADELLDDAFEELDEGPMDTSVPTDLPELVHVAAEDRGKWRDALREDARRARQVSGWFPPSRTYEKGASTGGGSAAGSGKALRREEPRNALVRIVRAAARKEGATGVTVADAEEAVKRHPEALNAFANQCREDLARRRDADPDYSAARFPALAALAGGR